MKRVSVFFLSVLLLFLTACFGPQRPAPVTHYGIKAGAGSAGVHTVIEGDTLWSISQRYQLPMRDIAVHNRLAPPFVLAPGMRLRLPPPREYRVRPGDTLYSVSRLFGVDMTEIASLNNLHSPYILRPHQILRLPSMTRKTQTVSAAVSSAPEKAAAAPPPGPVEKETLKTARAPADRAAPKKSPITAKTPKRSSGKFLQPVNGRVLSGYGPKKDGLHNDGMNIAAPRGTPVLAAENGVVVYAGNELKGSGNLVLLRHEDRWMTAYAHMDNIAIKRGDVIRRGQKLGSVGSTGSVDTPQLHFEVRRGTQAVNPQVYLGG